MKTKEKILNYLKRKGSSKGKEIQNLFGLSRQALNVHLKKLIQDRYIIKEGTTKGTMYHYCKSRRKSSGIQKIKKKYDLKGLEEHVVYQEIAMLLNLKKHLRKNVLDIFLYAFTEILNNAIEHSQSKECLVETFMTPYACSFRIRDYGIGIFCSLYEKFGLRNEYEAVGELIKGKTTTMKDKHTGEGVFFTSKSADRVSFRAHKINLIFDNTRKDVIVEEKRFVEGTDVFFSISRNSRRKLDQIFARYAPADYDYHFDKTRVYVKLFDKDYVSRSEARRLVSGLDKFKEIILDFKGVHSLGQGFLDEIFRVFLSAHPDTRFQIENLSPSMFSVLSHVVDKKILESLTIIGQKN